MTKTQQLIKMIGPTIIVGLWLFSVAIREIRRRRRWRRSLQ